MCMYMYTCTCTCACTLTCTCACMCTHTASLCTMYILLYVCTLRPLICCFFFFCFIADEAEQNFSEDDGWEFVTLADQVTVT